MRPDSPTAAILGFTVLFAGCNAAPASREAPRGPAPSRESAVPAAEWFTDRATELGLDFVHVNGSSGQLYIPEILAPGAAMFDYDGDGDLDVFLIQGRMLGTPSVTTTAAPPASLESRLFRNDLDVSRTPRFVDVTRESGIHVQGYPMGAAAADFDNDGCVDLFVTGFGRNQLFRNSCRGTFTDVWKQAGGDWSVSASFVDFDRDGWLDLYVGNYVQYALDAKTQCHAPSGEPDYCTPQAFRAQPDRLYRNQRDGTFADVSAAALAGSQFGPALGVSTADFNNDGWIDIYVANDGDANLLWINQRDGTFKDVALLAGAALSAEGKPEGSMGVDAGDFDNDGDEDLYMTHLPHEGNNLYVNDGTGMFEDRSAPSGVGPMSVGFTGFGTAWIDYDNDGWLDLLNVNGAVSLKPSRTNPRAPYEERNGLFRNLGHEKFEDVSARAGAVFALSAVFRGAAFGDIDNDGDTDVLVTANGGPVRLLINDIGNRRHWLGVRLVGDTASRDMIGARISVMCGDGRTLWRRARSDGSYASANDPRVLVGLGDTAGPVRVRVTWPDGKNEEWADVPIDRWMTLKQGTGT
jgi:enediyne biosynthesis protein E4